MKLYQFPFKAMGTACELQLYAVAADAARQTARRVIDDIDRLEQKYSRYLEHSFLSTINRAAASGDSLDIDTETAGLLDYADTCFRESGGLFDITSGILRRAWDFKSGELPDPLRIEALLDRVGWHKVTWQVPRLAFPVPGMELDFGGVVKEYAVDRAATLCLESGIAHGIINLGGDIRVLGPHPGGSPWQVAVRHPDREKGLMVTLQLSGGALASSGDYERCITLDGVRYGHVLNPRTGWPVRHLAAVSVIADLCVVAGSASTIAMLKEDQGKTWLNELGLDHLWSDMDGNTGGSLAKS